jgi:tetratricopeptide (TPR) repeat protein
MAIPISGYTVVVKKDRIRPLLLSESISPPNSTALEDDDIWCCSFMTIEDADKFMLMLGDLDLNVRQGPDSDAVLVNEFDQSIEPYCEWIVTGKWEKAVIAWKAGTIPKTVVTPEGWDPKIGSGLIYGDPKTIKNLQFLRLDGNIEVYLDKDTGKELYRGRTSIPVESMFKAASKVIGENFVMAGDPPLNGEAAKDVAEAVEMLEKVIDEVPDRWNVHTYYGKGLLALGKNEQAYNSFRRAYELEKGVELITRELAGVCLELMKYDEAVEISEKSAALSPDKADILGNLSLAYLMAGRIDAAMTTISATLKIDERDKINQYLYRVISEVSDGKRDQPKTLDDLSKPIKTKKKPFWKLW